MICGLFSLFWCLLRASWLLLLFLSVLTLGCMPEHSLGMLITPTAGSARVPHLGSGRQVLTSWTESRSVAGEPQERVNLVVERKEKDGKGCMEQKSCRERVIDSERPAGQIPALLSWRTMPWFPKDFIWTAPSHFLEWKHLLRPLSLATPTTCAFFFFFHSSSLFAGKEGATS